VPLDLKAQAYLEQLARLPGPPMHELSPADARAAMLAGAVALGAGPDVGRVEDRLIPGAAGLLRVRITAPEGPGPFPALVFYHGGGWVVGSIDTHDALCRALTCAASALVVSVEYRLAPEHPYPAGVDDAYAAASWVADHAADLGADAARLALGGDSAGGNLAAVVALKARDQGGPRLALQVLLYPITDYDFETPSYRECAEGYMLTRAAMIWFWDQYLADPDRRREPYASPLQAADLKGLPPALVVTAEYDPLRDEAEAYASRLRQAGVPVKLSRYDGMIHGFLRRSAFFDQGRAALDEVAAALRALAKA
jgi:acetyl esterase